MEQRACFPKTKTPSQFIDMEHGLTASGLAVIKEHINPASLHDLDLLHNAVIRVATRHSPDGLRAALLPALLQINEVFCVLHEALHLEVD